MSHDNARSVRSKYNGASCLALAFLVWPLVLSKLNFETGDLEYFLFDVSLGAVKQC